LLPESGSKKSRMLGVSEPLLSVREVAAQLKVSTAIVYKLCEQGELPHVRVLNSIRVTPADLAAFLLRRGATT
jgi:excisionase family DNA binding protein